MQPSIEAVSMSNHGDDDEEGAYVRCRGELQRYHEVCRKRSTGYWVVLSLSCFTMLTAFPVSSILSRLYFEEGGTKRWLISWVAVAGWPITAIALLPCYLLGASNGVHPTPLTWPLVLSYAFLGLLSAADNLMYSWAYSYLPASTASLLSSTSLAFTALFSYLIISKKNMNASTINAVAVITAGAVILGLDSSSDKLPGVTHSQYVIGFILDIAGSALHGLIFALSELLFVKLLGRGSLHLVLEQQAMVSLFGCVFTTIGGVVSGELAAMRVESHTFLKGPLTYYMVLAWAAITFQLGILASVAALFLVSTLLAGILNAVRVPITSIAAVIFLRDSMDGYKIMALLLTFWGFSSYVYGGLAEVDSNKSRSRLDLEA